MSSARPKIYQFGNFCLEAEQRQLLRQGNPVPLTPKVFDTLLYLVHNHNKVIGKDELMRALWPNTVVEENNLNQNISVLRRVLGGDRAQNRYIATIPGRGYRFMADVRTRTAEESTAPLRVIAVLPFKPLVAANRDEPLELGMTEALITKLSSSQGTVVRPLSAVRRYGGLEQDPVAAGRELGADSILDGSIQREGNQIRMRARLLTVPEGKALWAQTFDEEFTSLFAVQEAISERVAAALALQMNERKNLRQHYTENVEAYHLYLKGWYHLGKATLPTIMKGIEFCQQAIDLDPVYALAYAGMAEGYRRLPITSDVPPRDAFPKAMAAAAKALEIDETISEAHTALGFSKMWFDWDWEGSEQEFERAIALHPHSGMAHMGRMILLTATGRHEEAFEEGEQVIKADPLSPILNANVGWALHCAGRNDVARTRIDKTLELEPNFWIANLHSGRIHLQAGTYADAIAAFAKARTTSGENSETISLLAYAYALSGDRSKAREILAELDTRAKTRYVPPHNIAVVYQGLGETDQTFRWLEKAFEDRDVRLSYLKVDPKWESCRSDPRFKDLLRRIGL